MIFERGRTVWLVMADGVHAQVHTLHMHPFHMTAVPSEAIEGIDTLKQDLESDTHGGAQRHRKEEFAHKVTHALNTAHARGLFHDLVMVAPAPALGDLRSAMTPAVHKSVVLEIVGEWTGLGERDVLAHLKHHLMPLASV